MASTVLTPVDISQVRTTYQYLAVPSVTISQEELSIFHSAHFSNSSVSHFTEHFLGPVDEDFVEDIDDDGLGYYEDGVKRTLTDEQIAIFRHSEIEALLRDRRHAKEAQDILEDEKLSDTDGLIETPPEMPDDKNLEDGELEGDEKIEAATAPPLKNQKKAKKQNENRRARNNKSALQTKPRGFFKQNVKPDLRKRTWDLVDTGLGNLDYDEVESNTVTASSHVTQRRRISYDD